MVDQLNDAQFGYMNTLRHLTDDARALATIERDYQKNKEEAERLNSGYLSHLADQNNMLAKMAHHISSMRRATDAFQSSVISYIDALEQEGFTNLQKEMFMTFKGFIRGPLQNFNKLITESKDVLTQASSLKEAKEQEASLKALEKITDPDELIKVLKGDEYLKDVFSEQLMAWEKMQSGDLSLVALGQNVKIFQKFGEVLDKELGKLGGDDGIIATLTKNISDANNTITINTDLLGKASGGLMTLIKDSLKAGFEGGKTRAELITDVNAVASVLKDAGLDIQDFIDYINRLTPKQYGGAVSAGRPYLVGEQGPEMFMPSRSGWITPNNALASGPNDVIVNIYDGTGQRISEFDSAIRVDVQTKAERLGMPKVAELFAA
jgi:hypothetical protein